MPEVCHLIQLLPEVQETLSSHFAVVDCCLGAGPDLSRPPFNLPFRNLGKQVTFVPDSCVMDEMEKKGLHQICLSENSFVLTDGVEGTAMEVALQRGKDWMTPLRDLFHTIFSSKWTFLIAEVEGGSSFFHILSSTRTLSSQVREPSTSSCSYSIWIVPVTRIFAVPPPPPKKVKVIKKVVKKKSPSAEGETEITLVKKVISKVVKKKKEGESECNASSQNGECNGGVKRISTTSSSTPAINIEPRTIVDSSDEEDMGVKLRQDILENERKQRLAAEENARRESIIRRPSSRSPSRLLGPIIEGEGGVRIDRRMSATDKEGLRGRTGLFMNGRSHESSPPLTTINHSTSLPSSLIPSIPFTALHICLKSSFTYEELGNLRSVHPHWDEMCGQLLNSGYYALLERSDKLLMRLQRGAHADSALNYPVSVLTNIQVHILNPVDIMRAALDEGICCFPYGVIIDRTMVLLDRVERMVATATQVDVGWEHVALMAKRASMHYRSQMEQVMEERMGTCARLKAAQRIIRMDSMIVEGNVHKLEKESVKARDELRWELEQVQMSNSALKKENRQLKQEQMKLEARMDALEQKLRTISRLLS